MGPGPFDRKLHEESFPIGPGAQKWTKCRFLTPPLSSKSFFKKPSFFIEIEGTSAFSNLRGKIDPLDSKNGNESVD